MVSWGSSSFPRLEIFDMEFTNTEFSQFGLCVSLIQEVEFMWVVDYY